MGTGPSSCQKAPTADTVEVAEVKTDVAPAEGGPSNGTTPTEDIYWTQAGTFDYDKSTEDSYAIPQFTGPHKHIRPLLDYTWHKKYSEERSMLQDRILIDLSMKGDAGNEKMLPWVIFTAGAMGAGKGYVMNWMQKQGCLPLQKFIVIDPDEIRQTLPEWPGYVAKDPLTAAVKTQKEAGHIAEVLGYVSLGERRNVIFDGSLRDVEWYKVYFQKLRYSFPGIRLMILHIQAEREAVLRRAETRGQKTGRMVPRELLESSMDAVPKSVSVLAPYVDVCIRVANIDGQEPRYEHEATALHPPASLAINADYIKLLWQPLDVDGDGELSKEEVHAALALGILTDEVLETLDTNHDGAISKEELKAAAAKARESASLRLAE